MSVIPVGTLMFDDTKASIELQAENILITNGGKFQVGVYTKDLLHV